MTLEKILKNYGLNEKQAKIYLACLELGSTSVQKISQKTGIPRSSCYEILDSLHQSGIVTTYQKKKVKYFSPEDPQKIIRSIQDKVEQFKNALPQLHALYHQVTPQPTVRFYQGPTGMKTILNEMLTEAKEIRSFTSAEDLFAQLGDYWSTFLRKRMEKKIPVRTIIPDSEKARERKKLGPQELREVRLIPPAFSHHSHLIIWENKVAAFSLKGTLMALVIESPEIAQTLGQMFEFMWQTSEFIVKN